MSPPGVLDVVSLGNKDLFNKRLSYMSDRSNLCQLQSVMIIKEEHLGNKDLLVVVPMSYNYDDSYGSKVRNWSYKNNHKCKIVIHRSLLGGRFLKGLKTERPDSVIRELMRTYNQKFQDLGILNKYKEYDY